MRCSRCEAENRAGLRSARVRRLAGAMAVVRRADHAGQAFLRAVRRRGGKAASQRVAERGGEHDELASTNRSPCSSATSWTPPDAERLGPSMHRMLDGSSASRWTRSRGMGHRRTSPRRRPAGASASAGARGPRAPRRAGGVGLRRRLRDEWPADAGCPAPDRMGLNRARCWSTGRQRRQADYTAVGDTTNVAARLQRWPSGRDPRQRRDRRLVGGYARMEAVGPLAAEGQELQRVRASGGRRGATALPPRRHRAARA